MQNVAIALILCALSVAATAAEAARPRADHMPGPVRARVLDVLDGDTLAVQVHVWIGQQLLTDVRIRGIDTPEMRSGCAAERKLAEAARAEVARLAGTGGITLTNVQLEKYAGRVLADVHTAAGLSIGDYLIEKGMARPYAGKRRAPWCGSDGRIAALGISASDQE
jgi:endonuclease YncB( thermonuclease family)